MAFAATRMALNEHTLYLLWFFWVRHRWERGKWTTALCSPSQFSPTRCIPQWNWCVRGQVWNTCAGYGYPSPHPYIHTWNPVVFWWSNLCDTCPLVPPFLSNWERCHNGNLPSSRIQGRAAYKYSQEHNMKVYCIHEHERHCRRGLCHRVGLDGNLAEILKDTKHWCEVEVSLVSRTCAAHGYRSITHIKPQISMQPIFIPL